MRRSLRPGAGPTWGSAGDARWEDVPDPTIQDPTDAIATIETTTIYGTDLHILTGGVPAVTEGRILGHEGVGVVTHRSTFDEWEQAYGTFGRAAEEKALKVVVTAS